ncbi:MAG: amidohydrolase family protein [Paludibacter sp.]|nr:amidohydrolase family protein [Paludibacter sp.]
MTNSIQSENFQLHGPFAQLLTMDNLPLRGALCDEQLEIITNAGIIVQDGVIIEIGNYNALKHKYSRLKNFQFSIFNFQLNSVCLPAFIDSHTHICWAGSRAKDCAMRLSGKSYLEIAAAGSGIWDTVTKTRAATLDELVKLTVARADELYSQGVGTIEVKSGYGLSVESELKILEAIRLANAQTPADLIPTCLAAHIVPPLLTSPKGRNSTVLTNASIMANVSSPSFGGGWGEVDYLQMLVEELLPEIKRRNLCNRVDIFVEQSAFSVSAARKYLLKAKEMGFDVLLHGDQFTAGAAALAAEVGALSIDHLEAADDREISTLAQSNVIPVALPAASLGLGDRFAPARRLLDAGCSLAIASDYNPGTAPMGNLPASAAILGANQRLTMAETLAAITFRAATALRLTDRGILKRGNRADFIVFNTNDYREILYRQGGLMPVR